MRISDWSSDVCSSDLPADPEVALAAGPLAVPLSGAGTEADLVHARGEVGDGDRGRAARPVAGLGGDQLGLHAVPRAGPIGRASCRERVCQSGYISCGDVYLKQKTLIQNT